MKNRVSAIGGAVGKALVNALIGAVVGLFSGIISGVAIGVVGMVSFHIFLKLTVDDPTPEDSLPVLFSVVAGALTGLYVGVPIGAIVGAVAGIIVGVRRLGGVIISVAVGTLAGALAGIAAPIADLLLGKYGITVFSYLAYHTGILFITAVGVIVGGGVSVYIGRAGNHRKTDWLG